jgi:coenzyme PQQ precursor peptide PqqA
MTSHQGSSAAAETLPRNIREIVMKIWNKPQVREQAVGMEVTAYLPADIDLI